MEKVKPMRRAVLFLALVCAAAAIPASEAAAQTSGVKGFFGGIFGHSSTPAPPPADTALPPDDTLSLQTHGKSGTEVYVAVARLYTESGKYPEAEEQYHLAMKKAPHDIRVLLGYAQLKDKMNQPEEALKLYQEAEQRHPNEPAVYNNLAVHFIRGEKVDQAIRAAQHAVELKPHEPRYRNNLAALFVEAGQPREAFKQLRAIYDEPVAHYDLGFLLNKRGMKSAAEQEFYIALQMKPGMAAARKWVEHLSRERSQGASTALGAAPHQSPTPAAAYYQRDAAQPAVVPVPPQYPAQSQYHPQATSVQQPHQASPSQLTIKYQTPPPAANAVPTVAAREPWAGGVRVLPPPAPAGGNVNRLPPVGESQASEQIAPDPPSWQR